MLQPTLSTATTVPFPAKAICQSAADRRGVRTCVQSSARVSEVTDTARSQGTETAGTARHILTEPRLQGPEHLHLGNYSLSIIGEE